MSPLKKNGKLIVEVPNIDDVQLSDNENYEKFYWQRGHIHYFNPKQLKFVFKSTGLKTQIIGIQRYSIENMFNWKLTNKPQLNLPSYNLVGTYNWIDSFYKEKLETELKCDTIIAVGKQ